MLCKGHLADHVELKKKTRSFMYILNSFTEVDILCFGCMELKKISFDFHKK